MWLSKKILRNDFVFVYFSVFFSFVFVCFLLLGLFFAMLTFHFDFSGENSTNIWRHANFTWCFFVAKNKLSFLPLMRTYEDTQDYGSYKKNEIDENTKFPMKHDTID